MLATLLERDTGVALPMSRALVERYGGELRFPKRSRYVFANFVSSVDGIVSYDEPGIDRAREVSAGHAADRFMLALLRAAADAVIVGAGTLRKEPDTVWTAAAVAPDLAGDFADLRARLHMRPQPTTILVTTTGDVDATLPVFSGDAPVVIATTREGARRAGSLPNARAEIVADRGPLAPRAIVDLAARESGGDRLLTEGGPTLFGEFLAAGVIDELFLTISPRLVGRSKEKRRLALVEGAAFAPSGSPQGSLLSLKSADDYLFARYGFNTTRD
jgi:riboflavin biosynthesis pyrimidine reductase